MCELFFIWFEKFVCLCLHIDFLIAVLSVLLVNKFTLFTPCRRHGMSPIWLLRERDVAVLGAGHFGAAVSAPQFRRHRLGADRFGADRFGATVSAPPSRR